ncbi:chromosomal replication initiator protein DnaA [Aestuariimicrobium soli]|uniref:chromosomal replication initiator protein DnaA n=1 Tax=Aestuariimicrobium soli TaxID=2035834 RepID=UPI003EB7E7D8
MEARSGVDDAHPATPTLDGAWKTILDSFDKGTRAWLRSTKPLTIHDSTIVIAVPSEFLRERVESTYRARLEESLSDQFRREMRIAVTIEPDLELSLHPAEVDTGDADLDITPGIDTDRSQDGPAGDKPVDNSAPALVGASDELRLNPKYNFETFVIGPSNRFAHAAAAAVAEAPGKSYNPLMIYGESGLGKTHLLHAIGHYVSRYYQRVRVKYVSTEELTNDFINAIAENRGSQFRRTYRDVDVLLIDDIQFLQSKIQTQEEFFHTFNTLHNAQKQIVMTSDRPPKLLDALEPRLRSRFEWGLITDIQPPDLETRYAILKKKVAAEGMLSVPGEALELIASRVTTNIRELEGALIRVTAFASLNRQDVDLPLAEKVLSDLIPEGGEAQVTPDLIMSESAAYFGVTVDELIGTSRTQALVTARQIAMYLCRELTDLSLPKIGAQFGGKDHTTVMHAERKIRELLSERRAVYNQVTELTNRIKSAGTR